MSAAPRLTLDSEDTLHEHTLLLASCFENACAKRQIERTALSRTDPRHSKHYFHIARCAARLILEGVEFGGYCDFVLAQYAPTVPFIRQVLTEGAAARWCEPFRRVAVQDEARRVQPMTPRERAAYWSWWERHSGAHSAPWLPEWYRRARAED